MKEKYLLAALVLPFIIFSNVLEAQYANPFIASMQYKKPDTNRAKNLLKGAIEDISRRTPYSSTWRTKSGKIIAHYSSQIVNYTDANGKLQPIDLALHSDSRGWVADQQPNPCYFHSDRSAAISLGKAGELVFNKNCSINGMQLQQQIVSLEGSDVKLDLSQGIHKELSFVTNGIESSYIFDAPLDDGGITITEELEFPNGCTFQKDEKRGTAQAGGWAGEYLLLSPDGKQTLARFHATVCYDAKKHWCFADYSIQKKDGKNILLTTVPSAWLSKAAYPVTVDPLIVGPTTTWTGGSTPSCIYPEFYTDSILVTIPADITITFFTLDDSYVSSISPNYTVPLSDGIIYFSTSCASNDTASCGDTTGICYLIPYEDFHNPFTCCYDPSCSPQTFWLDAHLSRYEGGDGCDTSTIWYAEDGLPPYTGFPYVFSAYLEGYTDSVTILAYAPTSQCSNSCTLTMNATIQYGVPPYTVKHPWAARDTIIGQYGVSSCESLGTLKMSLTIPGSECPFTCGNADTIMVPPPIVVDACGDTALNLQPQKVALEPVPVISVSSGDTVVCSGTAVTLSLKSCLSGTTYNWAGSDSASGTGTTGVTDSTRNTTESPVSVTYKIVGTVNGCSSDTITANGIINPLPRITIAGSDTLVLGHSETLTASGGITYSWSPSTGLSCTNCPDPVASPTATTTYTVTVTDSGGCKAMEEFTITVKDENITIPNVITPGGYGVNEYFFITNLQYYPNSQLTVYDRWGVQVYTSNNYQNNWNGGNQSDGVYYYLLTLNNGKKYKGFFQIIK